MKCRPPQIQVEAEDPAAPTARITCEHQSCKKPRDVVPGGEWRPRFMEGFSLPRFRPAQPWAPWQRKPSAATALWPFPRRACHWHTASHLRAHRPPPSHLGVVLGTLGLPKQQKLIGMPLNSTTLVLSGGAKRVAQPSGREAADMCCNLRAARHQHEANPCKEQSKAPDLGVPERCSSQKTLYERTGCKLKAL